LSPDAVRPSPRPAAPITRRRAGCRTLRFARATARATGRRGCRPRSSASQAPEHPRQSANFISAHDPRPVLRRALHLRLPPTRTCRAVLRRRQGRTTFVADTVELQTTVNAQAGRLSAAAQVQVAGGAGVLAALSPATGAYVRVGGQGSSSPQAIVVRLVECSWGPDRDHGRERHSSRALSRRCHGEGTAGQVAVMLTGHAASAGRAGTTWTTTTRTSSCAPCGIRRTRRRRRSRRRTRTSSGEKVASQGLNPFSPRRRDPPLLS
jgi:hypothetical protein